MMSSKYDLIKLDQKTAGSTTRLPDILKKINKPNQENQQNQNLQEKQTDSKILKIFLHFCLG